MNRNTLIITIIILVVIAGGALFFLTRDPETQQFQKEQIIIEQDLIPIELTSEEQQALKDAGIQIPPKEDPAVKALQTVRSSDELDAIEADLNETDLAGLDAELEAIENDLLGL